MPAKPSTLVSRGLTYQILSTVKPGPGKRVYKALRKAFDSSVEQEVILKVFPKKAPGFQEEFESLNRIRSSYCVQFLGFESFNGQPAFVLESVQGVSLLQLIHHFSLSPSEIRCLLSQIHEGLRELRSQKLCHGDLSLNNILLNKEGRIKFIDFGRGNYSHSLQGTPPFIAPEILQGGRPSFFSDLFSLGVIEIFLKNPHRLSGLKTRAPESFISESHPLLSSDPRKRHFLSPSPLPEDLSSLGYKVKDLMALLEERNWQTQKIPSNRKNNSWIVGVLILSLLAGVPSGSRPQATGFLHIRTHQWVLLKINNETKYSPMEIPLSAGTHHLQWRSSTQSGEKIITIRPGETFFLTDRDF